MVFRSLFNFISRSISSMYRVHIEYVSSWHRNSMWIASNFCYYTLVSRSISNEYRIFDDFPSFVHVFGISIHITIFWVSNDIFFFFTLEQQKKHKLNLFKPHPCDQNKSITSHCRKMWFELFLPIFTIIANV